MLVESFGSGVVALPPLWDPSISGPAPQHNMPVAIGLFVLFLLLSFGVLRGIITKAIPLVGLARSGQRAQGTVVDRAPPKDLRRSSTIPVIEFTSLDGQRVRFSDVFAAKRPEQPGDQVIVSYDPQNPGGRATMMTPRGAWHALGHSVLVELVLVVLTVGVLLDVVGVYRVDWL